MILLRRQEMLPRPCGTPPTGRLAFEFVERMLPPLLFFDTSTLISSVK